MKGQDEDTVEVSIPSMKWKPPSHVLKMDVNISNSSCDSSLSLQEHFPPMTYKGT